MFFLIVLLQIRGEEVIQQPNFTLFFPLEGLAHTQTSFQIHSDAYFISSSLDACFIIPSAVVPH